MFSQIFYLVILLFLIGLSPSENSLTTTSSSDSFYIPLILYSGVLLLIYLQNKFNRKWIHAPQNKMMLFANVELLAFFAFYCLYFSRDSWPQFLWACWILALYFFGMWIFHCSFKYSKHHLRPLQLLFPFVLPFLFLSFILDLVFLIPAFDGILFLVLISISLVLFFGLTLIFLPVLILKIWDCEEMPCSPLKERLEDLCRRAKFKHGGFKIWSIMNEHHTAAILGVHSKFRYVMFTKGILTRLSSNAIEAVLAHEIGHSYRKHLWAFPFIFLGMSLCLYIFDALSPSLKITSGPFFSDFLTLLFYVAIIGLYFRYVFGYFSRVFERQADLHVFELNVPPEYMIEALNEIGIATGYSHRLSNWHHFGIQERMDFLYAVIQNPKLREQHHRKVKISLYIYFLLLMIAFLTLLL